MRYLLSNYNEKNGTGYELWDHDYNRIGLKDPGGKLIGVSYNIPDDNTNPDGLAALFAQPIHEHLDNPMSRILALYDVIAFKSCYSNSGIHSEAHLNLCKHHYNTIAKVINQHPEKTFILLTTPPLASRRTNPAEAMRARALARWLKEGEFSRKCLNLFVFDLFSFLAESKLAAHNANMLKSDYRHRFPFDSHPNRNANMHIGPIFIDFVISKIQEYEIIRNY